MHPSDFPIIVGVTGHIHLAEGDIAALRASVQKVLGEIDNAAKGAEVLLLSSLAPGADQLVAQTMAESHPKWRLGVPLPFAESDYLETFTDVQDKEDYLQLTKRENVLVFNVAELSEHSDSIDESERADRYLDAGLFIARMSHILVTLWDGEPARGDGGTGQILEYTLQSPITRRSSDKIESRHMSGAYVYHIHANDERVAPQTHTAPGTIKRLIPSAWKPDTNSDVDSPATFECNDIVRLIRPFKNLQTHIRDVARDQNSNVQEIVDSLFAAPDSSAERCRNNERAQQVEFSARRHAAIDVLANLQQRSAHRFALSRLIGLIVGVILFEFTTGPVATSPILLSVYLLIILVVAIALRKPYHQLERRYLDYRALSEALRIITYMDALGLSNRISMRNLKSDDESIDWIASTIAWCKVLNRIQHGPQEECVDKQSVNEVVRAWVGGQRAYFDKAYRRQAKKLRSLSRTIYALMTISALLTIATIGILLADSQGNASYAHLIDWLLFFAVALGIVAGAIRAYADYRGFEEHLNRYAQFRHNYKATERILDHLLQQPEPRIGEAIEHLVDLAEQALQENSSWLALHRERALEPNA